MKASKPIFMRILFIAAVAAFVTAAPILLATGSSAAASAAVAQPLDVTLICGAHAVSVTDTPVEPTNHIVADELERRHCNAPFEDKLRYVDAALHAGAEYAYALEQCFPRLTAALDELKARCDLAAVDSTIAFYPNRRPMFSITREKTGQSIDREKACLTLYAALKRCAVKETRTARVSIPTETVAPQVTAAENVACTRLRSRFTTRLSGSTAARKQNVALALSKINGTVLAPEEEFSFNKTVGPRTEENGFQEAKIIVAGEYVPGTGGGVCQASTTVYNCALTADLKITAARNHTLEPSYVPPSLDAMVNAGSSDLRFVNTGKTPVFIRAYADGEKACVEIYGTALPYRIVTESVVLKRGEIPDDSELIDVEHKYIDASAEKGERVRVSYGKGSVKSEGYLLYYTPDNRLIRRVRIRTDSYAAHTGVIAIAP